MITKIVTFNLRVSLTKDRINNFQHRIGFIYEKLREELPEIIAFQEMSTFHLEMLEKLLPEYLFIGSGRDVSAKTEGLFTAIRRDAVSLFGMEVFWLGPNPYDTATRFENQSKHSRICVQTLLKMRSTGKLLRVYNVHTDHYSAEAACQGLQCVLDMVTRDKAGFPAGTVILGDFNAEPSDGITAIADAYREVPLYEATEHIPYTFHDYGRRQPAKIDYIYVSEELRSSVQNVTLWEEQRNGIWLSDHYPVAMELDI